MELPYRGLSRPPPTPRATSGPGEHSPAMYRCLHSPHVQLVVPSFPPRGPRALLCPETPPAMEAREGHHMRRDGLGPKQGSLIQKERRNTPKMSRTSKSSWLKRVSFWPHNRVHPITDSTEELPENQLEGLPISTLEEEALPNSIACEQASEHAPQEHLVLELPQAGAEDPPLPPLEAAGEASERGFTEDLPVNPACDRTEETPYVSKENRDSSLGWDNVE
ncbi:uncharacterized protein LOC129654260 [Bubalus kerabau]|uniref:uncharacterized protein LOC129654256 n=1 Tax=Bubalus carabanensis TaxID=3119969 RepID=UPI00244ED74A|nr:uncharacterized protein LOC129654256 [Bubalus carabanensis]XP_055439742.1 uncharacterized protein LOC129654260 [Bubalus carabanensis]